MKKILRLLAITLALAAAANAFARGNVPVVNRESIPATNIAGKPVSADQIRNALITAGAQRGWNIKPTGPGSATAFLDVRGKHSVTVDITYKAGEYSIKYRDSTNLKYDPAANSIHPKYNEWVQKLIDDTRVQLLK